MEIIHHGECFDENKSLYSFTWYEYQINLLNYRAYLYSNPFFIYVEAYILKKYYCFKIL